MVGRPSGYFATGIVHEYLLVRTQPASRPDRSVLARVPQVGALGRAAVSRGSPSPGCRCVGEMSRHRGRCLHLHRAEAWFASVTIA